MKIVLMLLFVAMGVQKAENLKANLKMNNNEAVATFGGGCFWCTEAIFDSVEGVISAVSGYSGGDMANPSYEDVCSGETGHAEVIQVKYNPEVISYTELLEIFFTTHDPTTENRQGADVGSQYRSIVLYHNNEQMKTAQQVIKDLSAAKIWDDPVVTQVLPFEVFYSAEKYHQEYYANNKRQMYCQMVITPKMEKFRKVFSDKLKR